MSEKEKIAKIRDMSGLGALVTGAVALEEPNETSIGITFLLIAISLGAQIRLRQYS